MMRRRRGVDAGEKPVASSDPDSASPPVHLLTSGGCDTPGTRTRPLPDGAFCTCLTPAVWAGDTIFRGQPMVPLLISGGARSPYERALGVITFREVGSMKSLRLLAVALIVCACTASAALACDAHKSGKADATTAGNVVASKTGAKTP